MQGQGCLIRGEDIASDLKAIIVVQALCETTQETDQGPRETTWMAHLNGMNPKISFGSNGVFDIPLDAPGLVFDHKETIDAGLGPPIDSGPTLVRLIWLSMSRENAAHVQTVHLHDGLDILAQQRGKPQGDQGSHTPQTTGMTGLRGRRKKKVEPFPSSDRTPTSP